MSNEVGTKVKDRRLVLEHWGKVNRAVASQQYMLPVHGTSISIFMGELC
jgi:hypothetical protein